MARRRVSKRTNNMEIGHAQDLHRTASASASNSVMYTDGSILVASGNALFDQQGKAGAIAFLFRRGKIQTERYRQSNTLATTETFFARINVRDNPCTSLRATGSLTHNDQVCAGLVYLELVLPAATRGLPVAG